MVLERPGVLEHAVKIVQTWHADMDEMAAAIAKLRNTPVMLVWGSKDRVVDLTSAEILGKRVQAREISVIQGAGHLPYEEEPEEFSRIVLAFLAQYSPIGCSRPSRREVT
jgi:pimeloyl-ACP methyl ester carboxylesterase